MTQEEVERKLAWQRKSDSFVLEVCSPPRVVPKARLRGHKAKTSIDLSTGFDLLTTGGRAAAKEKVKLTVELDIKVRGNIKEKVDVKEKEKLITQAWKSTESE